MEEILSSGRNYTYSELGWLTGKSGQMMKKSRRMLSGIVIRKGINILRDE